MQLGRNHPCHCGSGRKYKNCCLQKDEEVRIARLQAERAEQEGAALATKAVARNRDPGDRSQAEQFDSASAPNPDKPAAQDPKVEALNARWEEFEKRNFDGQIALFLKTVEEPELMDDEMAFQMLNTLYQKTITPQQRDRYDELVEKLRKRLPKVYAKSAHYYLQNCITCAVLAGRFDRIPAMMNELAQRAGKDIDIFNSVVEQLAYYGQLPTLIEAMHLAWPKVNRSGEIVPWGIDEFVGKAVQNLVFDYVERHPAAVSGDAGLFERLKFYTQVETERIDKIIALLLGQANRQWMRGDFTLKPSKRRPRSRDDDGNGIRIPKPIQQNLFDMSLDFQGRLRREANIPFVKSELGRQQIVKYFIRRLAGELEPRQSMLDAALNRPKPKTRPPEFYLQGDENSVNWLCPDRETLDHFLSGLFHFLGSQPYTAAMTFALIPAWLRFLETHQLISTSLREETMQTLHNLKVDLHKLLPKMSSDPALLTMLKSWDDNTVPEKSL